MGTRGLLGFIIKGVKKGTYNHWDSYPTGLGLAIMRWIQSLSEEDIIKMAGQVEKIEWVDPDARAPQELQDRYEAIGFSQTVLRGSVLNEGRLSCWYNLLYRTQGARALPHILDGSLSHLSDDTTAPGIEWKYFIDFEKRELIIEPVDEAAKFEDLGLEYAVKIEYMQDVIEGNLRSDEDSDRGEDDGEVVIQRRVERHLEQERSLKRWNEANPDLANMDDRKPIIDDPYALTEELLKSVDGDVMKIYAAFRAGKTASDLIGRST